LFELVQGSDLESGEVKQRETMYCIVLASNGER